MTPYEYKAWLFDLDGTLYRQRPVRIAMAWEMLTRGWRAIPVVRDFRRQHEQLRREKPAVSTGVYRTQLQRTSERLGRPVEEIEEIIQQWMIERPGRWLQRARRTQLLHEIEQFHHKGGKTGLVSDYPARAKLTALGASALFDVVVANGETAGEFGLKPDPAGYLLAAAQLNVAPSDCLVWGDRTDADGAAATAAGMEFRRV